MRREGSPARGFRNVPERVLPRYAVNVHVTSVTSASSPFAWLGPIAHLVLTRVGVGVVYEQQRLHQPPCNARTWLPVATRHAGLLTTLS